jgi:hypothetical protein
LINLKESDHFEAVHRAGIVILNWTLGKNYRRVWANSSGQTQRPIGIFCDLEKVIDCVDHEIFLSKSIF